MAIWGSSNAWPRSGRFRFARPDFPVALEAYEGPLRVAVAYDDAFRGYFPDTLDLLELRGATVCEFSPLRDERLPADTDIVYFGCGHPERFLPELAENDCMLLALKGHLCSGRRMYAECGGLAYLCQQLEMPDGLCWPMVGALPVTAQFHDAIEPPKPVELNLATDTWLAPAGAVPGLFESSLDVHPPRRAEGLCRGGGSPVGHGPAPPGARLPGVFELRPRNPR